MLLSLIQSRLVLIANINRCLRICNSWCSWTSAGDSLLGLSNLILQSLQCLVNCSRVSRILRQQVSYLGNRINHVLHVHHTLRHINFWYLGQVFYTCINVRLRVWIVLRIWLTCQNWQSWLGAINQSVLNRVCSNRCISYCNGILTILRGNSNLVLQINLIIGNIFSRLTTCNIIIDLALSSHNVIVIRNVLVDWNRVLCNFLRQIDLVWCVSSQCWHVISTLHNLLQSILHISNRRQIYWTIGNCLQGSNLINRLLANILHLRQNRLHVDWWWILINHRLQVSDRIVDSLQRCLSIRHLISKVILVNNILNCQVAWTSGSTHHTWWINLETGHVRCNVGNVHSCVRVCICFLIGNNDRFTNNSVNLCVILQLAIILAKRVANIHISRCVCSLEVWNTAKECLTITPIRSIQSNSHVALGRNLGCYFAK